LELGSDENLLAGMPNRESAAREDGKSGRRAEEEGNEE
jgi:hypothetical protein